MKTNNLRLVAEVKNSKRNIRIALVDGKWVAIVWDENGNATEVKLGVQSTADLEKFFQEHGFQQPYNATNKAEYYSTEFENHETPYMALAYYGFLASQGLPPTLDQFVEYYINKFCQGVRGGKYTFKAAWDSNPIVFERKALVGRLSRSYNSYNRELHLLFSIGEHKGVEAEYDLKDDLYKGIDLSVWRVRDDRYWGIASFVDTASSNGYKYGVKNVSRHQYNDEVIDVKASLDSRSPDCFIVNNVVLHSHSCVDRLVKGILAA